MNVRMKSGAARWEHHRFLQYGRRDGRKKRRLFRDIFFSKAIADLAIKYRLPSAAVLRSYPRVAITGTRYKPSAGTTEGKLLCQY
jgi:hypothetical protein